ncbi:DUF3347 domain-containing protein [Flavitalea flava]
MKKWVLLVIVLALAGLLAYKLLSDKDPGIAQKKDQPLHISKNSGAFNNAFTGLLSHYYALKDALVEWDTVKADQAAYALALKADSLPLKELKGDSTIVLTAQSLAASVGSEAKGLMGENDIEAKRRAFNMLTDELYNLIRTVRYDGEIIYHVKCPMAFKDSEEGYWLSDKNKVVNPYLGKKHPTYKDKMLGCGEVSDSLDFVGK